MRLFDNPSSDGGRRRWPTSLDGWSKSRIAPFLALILLWTVPLFQVLALSCATVSIWRL